MSALGQDEDAIRRAVVLGWYVEYLGRLPNDDELNIQTWALAVEGPYKVRNGILRSPEAEAFRKRRGW